MGGFWLEADLLLLFIAGVDRVLVVCLQVRIVVYRVGPRGLLVHDGRLFGVLPCYRSCWRPETDVFAEEVVYVVSALDAGVRQDEGVLLHLALTEAWALLDC